MLVAGGINQASYILGSAELYDPSPPAITSPLTGTATAGLPFSYQFEGAGATSLEPEAPSIFRSARAGVALRRG